MTWRQLNILEKKTFDPSGKGDYFVVEFKCDNTLSVVDRKKILTVDDPKVGNTYEIKWSKKKAYEAVIHFKECSKKEAELAMANFIEKGVPLCESGNDNGNNKERKSVRKHKSKKQVECDKENNPPNEETLIELAKGLKPGEGKFVIELGSPATPEKKQSIDEDSEEGLPEVNGNEEKSLLSNVSSLEISDNQDPGAKMTIDIDSFENTPERNPMNVQRFHPSKDNCCKCQLIEPMLKEILCTVQMLTNEVNSIKAVLRSPAAFRNLQPSYYPPFNFIAPEPPRSPFYHQACKPTAVSTPTEIMITDVEQASPRPKKQRYDNEFYPEETEYMPPLPPPINLHTHTPQQTKCVQTPYGRPTEDPLWYENANKSTPRSSFTSTTGLSRLMKPEAVFTLDFLLSTKRKSCSIGNFAANLTRVLFSEDERRTSNVRGKREKGQLNSTIMNKVREAAFKMYPVSAPDEDTRLRMENKMWGECIKAIDESGRRLARPRKVSMMEETNY